MIYIVLSVKRYLKKYLLSKESHNLYEDGWRPSTNSTIGIMLINLFGKINSRYDVTTYPSNYKSGMDLLKVYVPEDLLRQHGPFLDQNSQRVFMQYLQASFTEDMHVFTMARTTHIDLHKKRVHSIRDFMAMHDLDEDDIQSDSLLKSNYRHRLSLNIKNDESDRFE